MRVRIYRQAGFTLIELIMAMAIFSLMLLIIVGGFINIVKLHNHAMALNSAQDNARSAMDQLTQAIRGSSPGIQPDAGAGTTLCLQTGPGVQVIFYVSGGVLYRANDCVNRLSPQPLTNTHVRVTDFKPVVVTTTGSAGSRYDVELSLTVATSNSTTSGSGEAVQCNVGGITNSYCAVVTLKSGATPR